MSDNVCNKRFYKEIESEIFIDENILKKKKKFKHKSFFKFNNDKN